MRFGELKFPFGAVMGSGAGSGDEGLGSAKLLVHTQDPGH